MIGQTLSHFRITAKLGEGGMGEVYRAEDLKLGREVAIKVLPEAVALDPERLARFEREAKVLASLNHPHIAAIYSIEAATTDHRPEARLTSLDEGEATFGELPDAGQAGVPPLAGSPVGEKVAPVEADGRRAERKHPPAERDGHPSRPLHFLVMELVDGATLQELIEQGVPLEQALEMAGQVAEALEEAHERGIVHRDLKPANIKVTPEGKVKVLDFGLAKALDPVREGASPSPTALSMSPTLTAQMTQAGVLLGTAAYMSPEQARGQEADKRADIWAFGVILWEMLCGRRLFAGPTVSDTLAEVLKTDPDLDALPAGTPMSVRRLLRRCLSRDTDLRLRDIGDARIELAEAGNEEAAPTLQAKPAPRPPWVPALVALILGGIVGAGLYSLAYRPEPVTATERQTPTHTALTQIGEVGPVTSLAISRDGSIVAIARGPESPLLLRRLAEPETTPIADTQGASFPFFSPDGQWIAFFDGDELRKMALHGGAPTVICEARTPTGGTWSDDGSIYFTHGENRLARVSAEGGEPQELSRDMMFTPHALPGGRGALVTLVSEQIGSIRKDNATVALVTAEGQHTPLLEGGYAPKYSTSGHLVFMRQGDLWSVPFDLDQLEIAGSPSLAMPEVWNDSTWPAAARFALADSGTLVYIAGVDFAETVPTWLSRDGSEEPLSIPRNTHGTFQLSPDRSRLALQVTGAKDQIQIYDFARNTLARLTFEGPSWHPTWSHDGREVLYAGLRDGKATILRRQIDSSSDEVPLFTEEQLRQIDATFLDPYTVSPDGRFLIFTTWGNLETGADLWALELDGESDPRPLLQTEHNELIPMFSPDGRYFVYLSNKAGPYGVFVRPFPDVERREWPISTGAFDPRWSPTGDEILYRVGLREIRSVPVELEPELSVGSERPVLEADFHDAAGFSFDVSADGSRILINKPAMSFLDDRPVMLVTGLFAGLENPGP